MKKENLIKYYECIVVVLALITIIITLLDLTCTVTISEMKPLYYIDNAIWIFFIVDYVIRFIKANDKLHFFLRNIFDLIAILPFGVGLSIFRAVRIFRVAKLSKLIKLTKLVRLAALASKFKKFLYTNGFIYILYANIITIALGAVGIYFAEYGTTVNSFPDALWWAFVTATTVGYGDISPSTGAGRLIAGCLMVVGIAFVSMLTGTIATYFSEKFHADDSEKLSADDISKIKEILEKMDK